MATRKQLGPRERELARIHCLVKELGLSRDQYEAVLLEQARESQDMRLLAIQERKSSAKHLDQGGRARLIAHLQRHVDHKKPPISRGQSRASFPGRPHNADTRKRQTLTKIEALLTDAGKPWAYAAALADRMFRRERLEFCSTAELAGIVTALEKQALKRLRGELQALFGEWWEDQAAAVASLLFGFDSQHRDVSKYTEAMSLVVRWRRGEITAACVWPVSPDQPGSCCGPCQRRSGLLP